MNQSESVDTFQLQRSKLSSIVCSLERVNPTKKRYFPKLSEKVLTKRSFSESNLFFLFFLDKPYIFGLQ